MSQASTTDLEIEYPSSDGKPMAETDLHRDWMMYILQMLSHHFAGQPVYISGNLLVYYVEGDPKRSVAPDAFVVKGLEGTELVLIDESTGARLKTDSERADDERAAREEIERRATESERHAKEAERQAKDADARANHADEQARKERAVREELEHEVARLKAGHAPNAQT